MFTLKILIGGKQVVEAPEYTYEKVRNMAGDFENLLPSLRRCGRVTMLACDGIVNHLLGTWSQQL